MTGQPSPCDTVGMAVELKKRQHESVVLAKMVEGAYRWIIKSSPGRRLSTMMPGATITNACGCFGFYF